MHAELCAQPGRSIAWDSWATKTHPGPWALPVVQVAAVVATIQHIAHAWDATSNGVTLATHGRKCAGNATDHDMNSTIVASFSRDVGVLEAMANLSDDIEKFMRRTATEHASTQESVLLVVRAYM